MVTLTPSAPPAPPVLVGHELPGFAADNLAAVRAAFQAAGGCGLGQSWLPAPEADFTPGIVRVGWRGHALCVLAELEDADIFSRATASHQRMWELGDTFEIFLQPAGADGYGEFHVTPPNHRLQLKFPDATARARIPFAELVMPGAGFHSHTWLLSAARRWVVYAEIPAAAIGASGGPLAGTDWRFSFSRYDYIRGRAEPILSSSSPHPVADFHRRQEWGTLRLAPAEAPGGAKGAN